MPSRWRKNLDFSKYLLESLTSALAPPRCIQCLVEGTWLCAICQEEINTRSVINICLGCESDTKAGRICAACRPSYSLDGVLQAAAYQAEWAKRGVHWLKFKGIRAVAPTLARQVIAQLFTIAPLPILRAQAVLIPIPLHPKRLRERGFNQSADIAHAISGYVDIPVSDILIRQRATKTQAKLPHLLRAQNMADAFTVKANVKPALIALIVDDVTTTGSTLNMAAKVLKQAGFKQCWGLTIARG